jgi:hypothetical protein
MKTLVSLVSDQTIPNLELIKEFKAEVDKYLFFHSERTSRQADWLIEAASLDETICHKKEIDPFDVNAIQNTLQSYPFGDEDYILNITGGTKPWIIVFLEKFKDLGAEIYYLTGKPREYMKVFPRKGQSNLRLNGNITLSEYLIANGFSVKPGMLHKDQEQADRFFWKFTSEPVENFIWFIEYFRPLRNSKKIIEFNNLDLPFQQLLNELDYKVEDDKLNKYDFKYLSGDWLEEWTYYKVKEEFGLNEDEISTGSYITKEQTPNEMDVMFLLNHQLYIIECKTAVKENLKQPDGSLKLKTILSETIYKSEALRSKLGLFANSSILTLSEMLDENMNPTQSFITHFDRAQLNNIKLISKRVLLPEVSFKQILKQDK